MSLLTVFHTSDIDSDMPLNDHAYSSTLFIQEEELRKEGGKYAHLNDQLHVYVEVFAEMTDAYARLSHAVTELKKFLIPVSDVRIIFFLPVIIIILESIVKLVSPDYLALVVSPDILWSVLVCKFPILT